MTLSTTAPILVDFRTIRCGHCKVALHDDLVQACPICGTNFDRVSSNHVGMAEKLRAKRAAAGIHSK